METRQIDSNVQDSTRMFCENTNWQKRGWSWVKFWDIKFIYKVKYLNWKETGCAAVVFGFLSENKRPVQNILMTISFYYYYLHSSTQTQTHKHEDSRTTASRKHPMWMSLRSLRELFKSRALTVLCLQDIPHMINFKPECKMKLRKSSVCL